MLKQQVNLYKDFQAKDTSLHERATWQQLWRSNAILAGFFFLFYLFGQGQIHFLKKEEIVLRAQVTALQKKFLTMKDKYPSMLFAQGAVQSLDKINQELIAQKKLLSSIRNQVLFSSDLDELSLAIVPNVWLTRISILKNGDEILLKGQSIGADPLKNFLVKIAHAKHYVDYSMSVKYIENVNRDKKDNLAFEIAMVKKIHE